MGLRAGGKEEYEIFLSRDPAQAYVCAEMPPRHREGEQLCSVFPQLIARPEETALYSYQHVLSYK